MSNIGTQIFITITRNPTSELHFNPINLDILPFYFTKSHLKIILLPSYWSPNSSSPDFLHAIILCVA
jgi:hypothetical protein